LGVPLSDPRACKLHPVILSDTFTPGSLREDVASSGRRPFLCTERRLLRLLHPAIEKLGRSFPDMPILSFQGGERNKTRRAKERLEDALIAKGADRNSLLIAVGGGVVTDLVGFTAATFMRGIPYASFPTTLLGMVDAALGGKTAVDTPRGKNIVGAFHPPKVVVLVLRALDTLPDREFRCGLSECLKHGLFMDPAYFEWISHRDFASLRRDGRDLRRLVETSVALKCAVADEDPEERTGRRNILNAGHTVGHALERLSGFAMSHGEAVAAGLLWEATAAITQGHLSHGELEPIRNSLARLGFSQGWRTASPGLVFEAAGADKKNRAGKVVYVPLGAVGRPALPPPHTAELTPESLAAGLGLLGRT
jgi:3-dehydroquinate synthase